MGIRVGAVVVVAVSALLASACGKRGERPGLFGVYHLDEDSAATLEIRPDGTYAVDVASCNGPDHETQCGKWAGGVVRFDEGAWWPTPRAYPATYVQWISFAREGDALSVTGWQRDAGRFEQTWTPGNRCLACGTLGRRALACGGGIACAR